MKVLKSKKTILIVFSAAVLLMTAGLLYYSNQNEGKVVTNKEPGIVEEKTKNDVREVVWKQLSSGQKGKIDGTWSDGKVSKITLSKNMMGLVKDKSYEGKEVYLIDFPTKNISVPNNMIVYADINTFAYIGNGLVD